MKQILLLLLLFPCLCLAQYTGNANQKITLGEQTTADGLVYRGVENDTALITPRSDTSAYIILDTVNNKFYNYNRTTNVWSLAGGGVSVSSFSAGTTGLTPNTATTGAVTLGGTLAVANGGTNTSTAFTAGSVVFAGASGTYAQDNANLFFNNTNKRLGIGTTGPGGALEIRRDSSVSHILLNNQSLASFTQIQFKGDNTDAFIFKNNSSQNTFSGTNSLNIFNSGNNAVGILTNNKVRLHVKGDGNVGIGTASPAARLQINNGTNLNVAFNTTTVDAVTTSRISSFNDAVSATVGLAINGTPLVFFSETIEGMRINSAGNVGIGTASPLSKLNVMGTVRINSAAAPDANYFLQLENSASQKVKANAFDTYSDSRIKTDIQPIINAIDKVNLLNPVYYEKHDSYVENDFLNIDYNSSIKSLGFIAQEVYSVIPEAVNTGTTNELWAMDYTKIIPILTKAIQEQQALIKALEQRILILENK